MYSWGAFDKHSPDIDRELELLKLQIGKQTDKVSGIKTTNKASQRSFESVGFAFLKQDGDVLHYQFAI